jgi:DNA-binding transcriptional regulator YiaG
VGKLVPLRQQASPEQSPEQLVEQMAAEIMAACRRRSGLSAEAFARAINARSSRRPGIIGARVRAWEAGTHPPYADVLGLGMLVAGTDAVAGLSYLLGMLTA